LTDVRRLLLYSDWQRQSRFSSCSTRIPGGWSESGHSRRRRPAQLQMLDFSWNLATKYHISGRSNSAAALPHHGHPRGTDQIIVQRPAGKAEGSNATAAAPCSARRHRSPPGIVFLLVGGLPYVFRASNSPPFLTPVNAPTAILPLFLVTRNAHGPRRGLAAG